MTRGERRYVIGLGIVFVLLGVLQVMQPKPVDWRETYFAEDARPYGSRVAFEQMGDAVGTPVRTIEVPPYLALSDLEAGRTEYVPLADTASQPTYVFVTDQTFEPDPDELSYIMHHAHRGATVLIAARRFVTTITDTLGIETDMSFGQAMGRDSPLPIHFTAPGLSGLSTTFADRYPWPALLVDPERADSLGITILARDSTGASFAVRAPWGAGQLLLTTAPMAFANTELLYGEGGDFLAGLLAYVPADQPIWWDDYIKPLSRTSTSPLRFILSHPSLRAAWQVAIGAVLLFVVLEFRRRERAIPIVQPPRNESLAFVRTLGGVYHQHGDHTDLARKKATYFLDYLRTRFGLKVQPDDLPDAETLAERTGAAPPLAESALRALRDALTAQRITSDALRRIARDLDAFRRETT